MVLACQRVWSAFNGDEGRVRQWRASSGEASRSEEAGKISCG